MDFRGDVNFQLCSTCSDGLRRSSIETPIRGTSGHNVTAASPRFYTETNLTYSRCSLLAAIAPLLIAASAIGQQGGAALAPSAPSNQAPAYTLQVKSQMVSLDVVVTDKQGHIVDSLTRKDFQVYEDKVPQMIHSFEVQRPQPPATSVPIQSTAELDRIEPDAPVSILVLDELNTKFEDEAFRRYSLKKYLGTQGDTLLQPTMLVAVNFEHFMVLRDYTTSRAEILAALDHHLAENPWKSQTKSFQADQFNGAFTALLEVAQATAGHPGHKNMIWVGTGFPSIDPTTLMSSAADALKAAIETCTNMLRDSRITLYTIDPAGLSVTEPAQDASGFDIDDPFGGDVDFNAMAEATGGKAFFGRNDVDKLIATSIQSGTNFYTLSYVPSNHDDTKVFRNIRVVLKDPNLVATTREGYYAVTPPLPPAADESGKSSDRLIFDLTIAGDSMMVYDGVAFTVTRDPAAPDNFAIHIDPKSFDWQSAGSTRTADLAVLVESFDKKGHRLKHTAKMITAKSSDEASDNAANASGFTIRVALDTASPATRLRFVVRMNRTGKIGADNFFLVDKK
jgi:VWFA-related protein